MTSWRTNLLTFWRRLSWLDLTSFVLAVLGGFAAAVGVTSTFFNFLKFLGILGAIYLLFRFIGWWRTRLLWSLRNRLIVAYLFIAVVPILLIITLVILASTIIYTQLGAYLLYEDIHDRIHMMGDIAEHIAAVHAALPSGVNQEEFERALAAQSHAVHDHELPGLEITFAEDQGLLKKVVGPGKNSFAGLLQQDEALSLTSIRGFAGSKGPRMVMLRVPVTPEFLAIIAPDLGVVEFNLMEHYIEGTAQDSVIYTSGTQRYRMARRITAKNRVLQPAMFWIDTSVNAVSRLNCVFIGHDGKVESARPVLAVFSARPSHLNARMFMSLGDELRDTYLLLFLLVGGVFFLIEIAALITGIVLTRRITKATADLYQATQYVQAGDLSHRVRVERRDQLGVLGESFNSMTGSISNLIEEQTQRQRLENEISIAREVQDQLFPRTLPSVPGVEIEAICKAARAVSGDYYDFLQLSPTHIAIAIADISGKGISAALLMASLQAALRSQMLTEGSETLSTAELVSRLNKHLVRNTGDDRFATFFIAIYNSATRTLRYTNAGHLPSFLICGENSVHLDKGGMVLGVLEDYIYEEGLLSVPPTALLVAYSDGLVEPENVYGEEFGIRRLENAAIQMQTAGLRTIAELLMTNAEEWAGTPDQADDMTVIIARLR